MQLCSFLTFVVNEQLVQDYIAHSLIMQTDDAMKDSEDLEAFTVS